MNNNALSTRSGDKVGRSTGQCALPLLPKLATTARMDSDFPVIRYNTSTETCDFGPSHGNMAVIWATGTYSTRADRDPTMDEPMDR